MFLPSEKWKMDKENKELFIDIGRKRIMLEKYRKNIELLKQAVETDAVIRPIAKHRKPDRKPGY